jgi:hypothetical protein
MKSSALAAVAALGVALSGCASIMEGQTESIAITSPPTTGANCTLSNSRGEWTVTTPGTVAVKKSRHDMAIQCSKPGFQTATASIPADFAGWTLGNLIIGGVIGIGIDAGTGAMNKYPHAFEVPMTPAGAAPGASIIPAGSGRPTS